MDGRTDPDSRPSTGLTYPFGAPPMRGRSTEVAAGVHWIRLPLPSGVPVFITHASRPCRHDRLADAQQAGPCIRSRPKRRATRGRRIRLADVAAVS